MRYIQHHCGGCQCVALTSTARCAAIQQLVRPHEVAHLVTRVPRVFLPVDHDFPASVAAWLDGRLQTRQLRYAPDPPACDRWCPPSETLWRGSGDCDDLAILVASMLLAGGVHHVDVVVGHHCSRQVCGGHAWVEGADDAGPFLIEPTSGSFHTSRPDGYEPFLWLRPRACRLAA